MKSVLNIGPCGILKDKIVKHFHVFCFISDAVNDFSAGCWFCSKHDGSQDLRKARCKLVNLVNGKFTKSIVVAPASTKSSNNNF